MKYNVHNKTVKTVWKIFKSYWGSEEKWRGCGLFAAVLALNLGAVYIVVLINEWYNTFYNALQNYEQENCWRLVGTFCLLAFIHIAMVVYALYLRQMLQIRWRSWLTERYVKRWTDKQSYYKLQVLGSDADNPDQRISEDIDSFVQITLGLIVNFLKQVAMLGAFIVILWNLSGVVTLPLGEGSIEIYGYMVWLSIAYALFGTWLTMKIGNPLVRLNFDQQRYEADFRYSMVRLRENSESVAFYRGEAVESIGFLKRFKSIFQNYWQIMRYEKRLSWFTSGYEQLAIIFPLLMAMPRYFSGAIQWGGIVQISSAFGRVQDALSFFVTSYTSIAQWLAVVKRLASFVEHMEAVEEVTGEIRFVEAPSAQLLVHALHIKLPDGRVLLENLHLQLERGDSLLVSGASGCGKSTLLRTLSGIWPFGSGSVMLPTGERKMFLPQRPYLPLGTLKAAVLYPQAEEQVSDARVQEIMRRCCLAEFADKLHKDADWSRILSLGEQQRLAFARVLLCKPEWIFLDESTSALDESTEQLMYQLLKQELPESAIISIGHRSTLQAYHTKRLVLNGGVWQLFTMDKGVQMENK